VLLTIIPKSAAGGMLQLAKPTEKGGNIPKADVSAAAAEDRSSGKRSFAVHPTHFRQAP